jgi:hypothetical protein
VLAATTLVLYGQPNSTTVLDFGGIEAAFATETLTILEPNLPVYTYAVRGLAVLNDLVLVNMPYTATPRMRHTLLALSMFSFGIARWAWMCRGWNRAYSIYFSQA